MVQIYAYFSGSTIINLTNYQYGLCTSSTAFNGTNIVNSYALETIPASTNRNLPEQTFIVHNSATSTNYYNQILLGWSTATYSPTITITYGFNIVRIA